MNMNMNTTTSFQNIFDDSSLSSFPQHQNQEGNTILGLSFIDQPHQTDIVSGRGKKCANHPGNKYFIQKIRENLHLYTNAPKKAEKTLAIEVIVKSFLSEGIRFLKHDDATELYFIMNIEQARKKTAFAIRDLLKDKKKNKKQSKSKECVKKQKYGKNKDKKDDDDDCYTNFIKMLKMPCNLKQTISDSCELQELLDQPIYDIPLPVGGDMFDCGNEDENDNNTKVAECPSMIDMTNSFRSVSNVYNNVSTNDTTTTKNGYLMEKISGKESTIFEPLTLSVSKRDSALFPEEEADVFGLFCESISIVDW